MNDPIQMLAASPLFAQIPPEAVVELAASLRAREIRCGEALVRKGDPGDSLFIIVDGRFEARDEQGDSSRVVRVMGRGEIVGEMSVITGDPRSLSVIAARRSSVLELPGADFLRILERHPAALLALTRRIVQRSTRPMPDSPVRRIAILPLDAKTDTTWLGEALERSLATMGSAIKLGRSIALGQLGEVSASGTIPRMSTRLLEWLAEQERAHEFVVYEAAHQLGEWTHRCLAQSDLVLLVGRAEGSPDLTALERELLGSESAVTLAPVHLAILRPDRSSRPAGTARWLDAREVALHHHVAIGCDGDVARLARIIAGRAIQLVLSGGGARAFAEIGVIRALEEAKLPIDLVGGTSMGAALAGFCAMELSWSQMIEMGKRFEKSSVKDVTFPFVSIFAGLRGSRSAKLLCDGWQLEDLPIGYFAVSTDLCRAEEVVHRRGPLWMAMRASVSIPVAFPPLVVGDRCLVDGGVLNNLPVDVMARLSPGRIVAVDTSREIAVDLAAIRALGSSADGGMSGWRLLWRRINPFRRREAPMLHIGDLLARASEVAAVRIARGIQQKTPVTLRIEPPTGGYRVLDFQAIDAIVDAGYRYAADHVDAWKASLLGDARRPVEVAASAPPA